MFALNCTEWCNAIHDYFWVDHVVKCLPYMNIYTKLAWVREGEKKWPDSSMRWDFNFIISITIQFIAIFNKLFIFIYLNTKTSSVHKMLLLKWIMSIFCDFCMQFKWKRTIKKNWCKYEIYSTIIKTMCVRASVNKSLFFSVSTTFNWNRIYVL